MKNREETLAQESESTITGVAANAKAGAVLRMNDGLPIYIEGMKRWDEKLLGKRLTLTGILRRQRVYPDVEKEGGLIHQGMPDVPQVLTLTRPVGDRE